MAEERTKREEEEHRSLMALNDAETSQCITKGGSFLVIHWLYPE